MTAVDVHRLQCAAMTNGCTSVLVFDTPHGNNVDIHHLVPEVPDDRRVAALLAMNGWRISYGKWVCGRH